MHALHRTNKLGPTKDENDKTFAKLEALRFIDYTDKSEELKFG